MPPGPTSTRATRRERDHVVVVRAGQPAPEADINTYLALMSELEEDYPSVKFVYMTGHTDGSGPRGTSISATSRSGTTASQQQDSLRLRGHRELRSRRQVLRGQERDGQLRLRRRQLGHGMAELPHGGSRLVPVHSAHSEPLNANLKAYAAWWMWARMAGWNGGSRSTDAGDSGFSPASRPGGGHRDGDRHRPDGRDGGEVRRHRGKLHSDLGQADHRHRPGRRPERQDRRHDAGRNGPQSDRF